MSIYSFEFKHENFKGKIKAQKLYGSYCGGLIDPGVDAMKIEVNSGHGNKFLAMMNFQVN